MSKSPTWCIIILVSVNHLKFRYSGCRWHHDTMICLLAPFLRCMQLSQVSTARINGRRQHSCLFFCEKPFLVLLLHNISKFSSVLWCHSNVDDIRCGIWRHNFTIKFKNLITVSQPLYLPSVILYTRGKRVVELLQLLKHVLVFLYIYPTHTQVHPTRVHLKKVYRTC